MLLRNGTILILSPSTVERADLRIERSDIVERARTLHPKQGEEAIDLEGKLILPGLVNAHTHLYSALTRGMSAPKQLRENFLDILKKVWWRLDKSLDEEGIYYSALVGSMEAIKYGTTALIDHHASPNCINGSLHLIKKAMSAVGVRGVLCYETTDRGGRKRRDEGLEENERFVTENANNPRFRGTIGAHASFTLSDTAMRALGELARIYDCGVHIHVAEAKADALDSLQRHGIGLVKRLEKFRILSQKSILAHGVHLSKSEFGRVAEAGTWVVHNPRSNMNNAVGYAPLRWFGEHTALGTDGFPADMFEESTLGFFRNQESKQKVRFTRLPEMLQAGQDLISELFGREFGTLKVGAPADLIVLDYTSPTPLNSHTLPAHFLFGMNSGRVVHAMVGGQWRMFDRQFPGIDEEKVMKEASKVAGRLWRRMNR